jgi:hypothetical protein
MPTHARTYPHTSMTRGLSAGAHAHNQSGRECSGTDAASPSLSTPLSFQPPHPPLARTEITPTQVLMSRGDESSSILTGKCAHTRTQIHVCACTSRWRTHVYQPCAPRNTFELPFKLIVSRSLARARARVLSLSLPPSTPPSSLSLLSLTLCARACALHGTFVACVYRHGDVDTRAVPGQVSEQR